jgi:predicted MFS family arabinose efflux permease
MHLAVTAFGPAALLVALTPTNAALYAVAAMILIDSFGIVVHGVNQISLRQSMTPEHLRGRMTATIRFLIFGAMPLGTVLGGVLGSTVGVRAAIWVGAGGLFLAAVPYTLSPIRRLVAIPTEPAPSA